MTTQTLYIDTDHEVTVDGLKDQDGAYVNTATVEATLYEADGVTEVSGQTWPLTLGYVSGSDGQYTGVLDDAISLTPLKRYILEVVAAQAGTQRTWRQTCESRYGDF